MFNTVKKTVYILLVLSITLVSMAQGIQSQTTENLVTGPELQLGYQSQDGLSNPVDNFMYFVPLTSPTSVMVSTEPGTTFSANITSWKRRQNGNTVYVECDFEITGSGAYSALYDSNEMINKNLVQDKKQDAKELTKLLEWIRLGGPCLGRIEGVGAVDGENIRMESIEVSFNRDGSKSPVEVSIYDVPRKKGQFLYANRRNCQVARVNALKFKRNDDGTPRMSVEIASVKKADSKEGFFSHLTAMIANILSTSTTVAPVGNTTMMDFGTALYEKRPAFTFPKAANIKTTDPKVALKSSVNEISL